MLAARTANPCLARKATRSAVRAAPASRRAVVVRAGTPYPSDWIKKDPLVPVVGFLGWTIPSNIPVSAFGGQSLFGLFTASIGEELAKFPQGPSIDDPFWSVCMHLLGPDRCAGQEAGLPVNNTVRAEVTNFVIEQQQSSWRNELVRVVAVLLATTSSVL